MKKIPTIEQLKTGNCEGSELQKLLETEPPKEWLKPHPIAKNEKGEPVMFLPIEKVDYLLRSIYKGSWTEIISSHVTQQVVCVTVRLFVINPETGRVEHIDGIGGESLRKGIEASVPLAESLAKKNAAKKLGKLFGRDLSRDYTEETKEETEKEKKEASENPVFERLKNQAEKSKSLAGLKKVGASVKKYYELKQINDEEIEALKEILESKATQN